MYMYVYFAMFQTKKQKQIPFNHSVTFGLHNGCHSASNTMSHHHCVQEPLEIKKNVRMFHIQNDCTQFLYVVS